MRFYSIAIFVFLILPFAAGGIVAQNIDIRQGAAMRVAGKHEFAARIVNADAGKTVWTLDREIKKTDGETTATKDIQTASGKRAQFDLIGEADAETVYRIRAATGDAKNETTVRVFPANKLSFFNYQSAGNPDIKVFIAAPPQINSRTKIVFVMHGQKRNAAAYLESWREWAGKNNYIAVAPEFDTANWEDSRSYNLGNLFDNERGSNPLKPAEQSTFTIVERIHRKLRGEFGVKDKKFDIFGHSAGAQFVHRFLFYKPDALVRMAFAANSGWFTLPELDAPFPYGWQHRQFNFTEKDLKKYAARQIILMRGTGDTTVDDQVRTTPEANRQGANRFERSRFMLDAVKKINPRSPWKLIDVADAAHEQAKMAQAAQKEMMNDE